MTDLKISKSCFICCEANANIRNKVMEYACTPSKKVLPINRYRHRYKTAIIPVMSSVFLLGGYLVYQNISTPIRVQNNISQTQSTISDLVTMINNETF